MRTPRVYIAGPMTGLPGWNHPAFHDAARRWRNAGWDVVNPVDAFEGRTDLPYRTYVEYDLKVLKTVDAVAYLPGWDGENARGSVWEVEVARDLLHLHVFDAMQVAPPIPQPHTSLEEAQRLVYGDREAAYSHPMDDFRRIGDVWGGYLGVPVEPLDVAMMMAMLKACRVRVDIVHGRLPKRDSIIDLNGYGECGDRIAERMREIQRDVTS